MQEEDVSRGFAIHPDCDSPLDLRMDPSSFVDRRDGFSTSSSSSTESSSSSIPTPTAAEVLGALPRTHLAQILKKYGDEKKNKGLAALIYDTKYAFGPIQTTLDFAKVISSHAYKPYQSERDFSSEQKRQTMNSLRALR